MRPLSLATVAALACAMVASASMILTGAVVFEDANANVSCTGTPSNWNPCDFWNTNGGDFAYNLYLQSTDGVTWINSGNGPGASISIPLLPGTYGFNIYGDSVGRFSNVGLNLFFDGETDPGISVGSTVANSTTSPPFSPIAAGLNTLPLMLGINGSVPSSGTASFLDVSTGLTVTLTDFRWETPGVQSVDLVSGFNNVPNGTLDSVGVITLVVTGPEPGTAGLVLLPLAVLLAVPRRRTLRVCSRLTGRG